MAEVTLQELTKIFDNGIKAISDFTLDIQDGEFMVIVGPSGCGKTTTLRVIAGLEEATSGTVTIGDKVVNNIPPKDRDISMVFQNYALYPHMTVFQNMAFALKFRKLPKVEIKSLILKTATMLSINDLLDYRPRALSGGQRQRVALGRAIVRSPQVFLFDEPLSNLDARLRDSTRTEIKKLHKTIGITSIYVTHNQAEAMTLAERICVMYKARIQQVGTPMEIYKKPTNRFVAGFFGMPPMNFIEGRICFKGSDVYFATENHEISLPHNLNTVLATYKDRQMAMGIRPENLLFEPTQNYAEKALTCKVQIVEPLGSSTIAYLEWGGQGKLAVIVRPEMSLLVGQTIKAYIDIEKVHIFEAEDIGRNISLSK